MNTEKPTYNPQSYFFVDPAVLAPADENNKANDAYGPVFGCEEEEYRTTSFVQACNLETPEKVFAICDGRVLIQPMTGSNDKVNLILKPSANYTPLKIKYFVYRGVRKADLIDQNCVVLLDGNSTTQPALVQNLWEAFKSFNNITDPTDFPASLIGYEELATMVSLLVFRSLIFRYRWVISKIPPYELRYKSPVLKTLTEILPK